ncbi:transcription factor bHLH95-like [Panicum miliaceum]|uniref:Transcription factor bHLH95-like n=1 Tax=Panicum miliaceum TaxID=4540 RepID=A0A3L6QD61_PANMI|nr:transcription factor bHLH95-like [Panicum miliaceum]
MAQNGPHDHQAAAASDERSFTPPTTMTFLGPAENRNGGSRIGSPVGMDASKGKDVVLPNAVQGGEHGSAGGGEANADKSKGKHPAAGNAATAAAGDGFPKGKGSLAADDGGDTKAHIITERERRKRMKDLFSNLHALMPHVPEKVDKATLVGETIHFIRALEQTKAQLERRKQEQALARQAAAEAVVSALLSAPQTAQGMAAMSNGWGPAVPHHQQPLAAAAAPPSLAAATGPAGFQTWSAPNVALSVSNEKAIINVCLPRQPRMLTLVMSVLSKHAIDVITAHVAADGPRSLITIYTRVNVAGGEGPSAEDIYKLAVSEIMVWLTS